MLEILAAQLLPFCFFQECKSCCAEGPVCGAGRKEKEMESRTVS